MKKCSMCKQEKPFEAFAKATGTKDLLQRGCRECKAKQYQENTGKYKEGSRQARLRRAEKLRQLKDAPCTDCGIKYPPYVMQYDHIGSDKVAGIAYLLTRSSWQIILDEIAKCELVCANCHAIRSYQRLKDDGTACLI